LYEEKQVRRSQLYCLNRDDGYHAPGQLLSNSRENDISGGSNHQAGGNYITSDDHTAGGYHAEASDKHPDANGNNGGA
jgi:hypothetical protein